MSLESVLAYRRHLEEVARGELAVAVRDLHAQKETLQRLEDELGRLLGEIARRQREGITAQEALALYRFAEVLGSDVAAGHRAAAALAVQKEQKDAILVRAARECRIVELLEARRGRERMIEEDRREQRAEDEVGLRRWQDGALPAVSHE
jgi:flagellar export protein FliJ